MACPSSPPWTVAGAPDTREISDLPLDLSLNLYLQAVKPPPNRVVPVYIHKVEKRPIAHLRQTMVFVAGFLPFVTTPRSWRAAIDLTVMH